MTSNIVPIVGRQPQVLRARCIYWVSLTSLSFGKV
jgi:hypothetical protein